MVRHLRWALALAGGLTAAGAVGLWLFVVGQCDPYYGTLAPLVGPSGPTACGLPNVAMGVVLFLTTLFPVVIAFAVASGSGGRWLRPFLAAGLFGPVELVFSVANCAWTTPVRISWGMGCSLGLTLLGISMAIALPAVTGIRNRSPTSVLSSLSGGLFLASAVEGFWFSGTGIPLTGFLPAQRPAFCTWIRGSTSPFSCLHNLNLGCLNGVRNGCLARHPVA